MKSAANENISLSSGDVGVIGSSSLHGTKSVSKSLSSMFAYKYDFYKYLILIVVSEHLK